MEFLQLSLVLLSAVMLSAILEQFIPRVSLPLVQMLIGVVIYFFVELPAELSIDTNLFLVMFIAPLLFDESRNANNRALWQNKKSILSMAIGLVLALVLVCGFSLHLIVPSVPLAAAFALGAALGPTDAVAVASLGKEVKLKTRQKALLTGEALLNDASGVVSFQFAIAAAVTGAFSVQDASTTFLFDFTGGIILGLVCAVIGIALMRYIRTIGVESVTLHLCFEIALPFIIYLIAEQVHVSGILAVVAAGLLLAYAPQTTNTRGKSLQTFSTSLSLASNSVWDLISFVLNGVIFVVLGLVLPSTIAPALAENSTDIVWLVMVVAVMTVIVEGVRFMWVLLLDFASGHPETGGRFKHRQGTVRNALITTLSGPKGAVSLSIAMTIPTALSGGEAFPQRNLLLFLVCGVVICTLLIANFVVPILAQTDDDDEDELELNTELLIMENVIRGLEQRKTPENRSATDQTIREYQSRIAAARKSQASARQMRYLKQEVLAEQKHAIEDALASGSVDRRLAQAYLKRIEKMRGRLTRRRRFRKNRSQQTPPLAGSSALIHRIRHKLADTGTSRRGRLEFKIELERIACEYLDWVCRHDSAERAEAALALASEHKPVLLALEGQLRSVMRREAEQGAKDPTARSAVQDELEDILTETQAQALRLELDEIQSALDQGLLSSATARELREEVYLLQMGLAD